MLSDDGRALGRVDGSALLPTNNGGSALRDAESVGEPSGCPPARVTSCGGDRALRKLTVNRWIAVIQQSEMDSRDPAAEKWFETYDNPRKALVQAVRTPANAFSVDHRHHPPSAGHRLRAQPPRDHGSHHRTAITEQLQGQA